MTAMLETAAVEEALPVGLIDTTLYELIEIIQDDVGPGADRLVTATVTDLLQAGRIAFLGDLDALEQVTAYIDDEVQA